MPEIRPGSFLRQGRRSAPELQPVPLSPVLLMEIGNIQAKRKWALPEELFKTSEAKKLWNNKESESFLTWEDHAFSMKLKYTHQHTNSATPQMCTNAMEQLTQYCKKVVIISFL